LVLLYEKLDFQQLHIPEKNDFYEEFKDIFDDKTWFEIMDYDISNYYKTIDQCICAIGKLSNIINGKKITMKIYKKLRKMDNKLPPFPQEFFKKEHFTTTDREFSMFSNNKAVFI